MIAEDTEDNTTGSGMCGDYPRSDRRFLENLCPLIEVLLIFGSSASEPGGNVCLASHL